MHDISCCHNYSMTLLKYLFKQHCDNLHKVMFRTEIQLGCGIQRITNEFQMVLSNDEQ